MAETVPSRPGGTIGDGDDTPSAVSVTLLYLIKQVELAIRSRLDDLTEAHSITTVQYTAMTVLERHPGLTSAELARNSFVRAQTMAQLVDGLESRGLVVRQRDPRSRRQMLISLTSSGVQLLDEMREPVSELEATMTTQLSHEQAASLAEMLRSCRVALSGTHPH